VGAKWSGKIKEIVTEPISSTSAASEKENTS
jgi:hypothetical protein